MSGTLYQPGRLRLSLRAAAPAAAAALGLALMCLNCAAAAPAAAGPELPAGGIAQALLGLAAVLALLAALAWLLKRYAGLRGTGSGLIRIVGGAAVGQRERVVLIEVGSTWLLVGVAPGQVRALHTMPRSESTDTGQAPPPADPGIAGWLQRMAEKRKHD